MGVSPASARLSVCKHFLFSQLLQDQRVIFFFFFFLKLGQNVTLKVWLRKYRKPVRRRPSLIFFVIASPQKLLGGFE